MAGLPVVLPIPQEAATASYNWTDLAEGTGVVRYYLTRSKNFANENEYCLITQTIASANKVGERYITGNGTGVVHNFDLSVYNTPKVLRGTAYFSCDFFRGTENGSANAKITVQKVDSDDNVTNVSSELRTSSYLAGTGTGTQAAFLAIPLTTTNFKKGDTLRLKVDVIEDGTYAGMGIDPSGEGTVPQVGGTMRPASILIPYNIDL
tara:strand:- start:542 stop:1162 length:621 start_codon:yes stop_codon:yes gene_type:complete